MTTQGGRQPDIFHTKFLNIYVPLTEIVEAACILFLKLDTAIPIRTENLHLRARVRRKFTTPISAFTILVAYVTTERPKTNQSAKRTRNIQRCPVKPLRKWPASTA